MVEIGDSSFPSVGIWPLCHTENMQRGNSRQKALEINMNSDIYGTFAEIGAGQEVVRQFFRAGGAAKTIAKSMSAYDMIVSDAIYGKEASGRYVCEERLLKMLKREYDQLIKRLENERSSQCSYFVFADTVVTKNIKTRKDGHGWLGVRFQSSPAVAPSEVILHVCLHDRHNLQQQEALGIIGVNIIHACYNYTEDMKVFINALMDDLSRSRIEVDMIRISGEAFKKIDGRLLALELVKQNLTSAVMFNGQGKVVQASNELYKRNILVKRGSFRPPTLVNMDMMETGLAAFLKDIGSEKKSNVVVLPEISMNKLLDKGEMDNADFLARIDLLVHLNHYVLITNFHNFHNLNDYLTDQTNQKVAIVLGVYNLEEIFDEKRYERYKYGLMGGIGTLLGHQTKLYVYPAAKDVVRKAGNSISSRNIKINPKHSLLLDFLLKNDFIHDIDNFNQDYAHIWSRQVLRMIQSNEAGWEKKIPSSIVKILKSKKLFLLS